MNSPKRKVNGKAARRKGIAFERDVTNILKSLGFPEAERNLEYQGKHSGHDVHYTKDG